MKTPLLWLTTIALGMAGCSKQPDSSRTVATNTSGNAGNPFTAPVDYIGAVAKAKRVAERTVDVASVNQAIQLFNAQEDRFPQDLNELVSKRYLPSVPPAPQGMRWLYNPANGELKAVRQ